MNVSLILRILIAGVAGFYLLRAAWLTPVPPTTTDAGASLPAKIERIESFGRPSGNGNLLGVQPYLTPQDYTSAASFERRLDATLAPAKDHRGWLSARTVVVFPEQIGTWLVAIGAPPDAYTSENVSAAMSHLISTRLHRFLPQLISTLSTHPGPAEPAQAALLRMRAPEMAAAYQRTFSRLAQRYNLTIVGGSIVLPEPRVQAGRIVPGGGPLQNVSFVFYADGSVSERIVRKRYPTNQELAFLEGHADGSIPVYETPAGRLGVLICADAWYPDVYADLARQDADFVAVVSHLAAHDAWDKPWPGYNGADAPADVSPRDVGRLSEGEAWMRYSMPARLPRYRIFRGINVFLKGQLWDIGTDGAPLVLEYGRPRELDRVDGASLINLWL